MPNLKPYTGDTKLVIAFDIGTTFSGISYCIPERGQIPEVHAVNRFPGQPPGGGDAKVPSILYYDGDGNVRAAGASVLDESITETALTKGWTKAEWWKLHLRPKHLESSINKNDDLPPLPPGKHAVDVLTDFIKYLFNCVKDYMQKYHPAMSWSSVENSIEYVFTHPNGWEGVQQQMYRQAIERAGLIPCTPEGRARVHMLTEGEASLHFCVANLPIGEVTDRADPQGVVIIDAGGGTLDLSMFLMELDPISCEEIAPAECILQGSVFVTRRARVLLEKKLQGWEHSSSDEIAEFTREFDQSTKLIIKSDQEPAYVRVAGRRTSVPKYNITHGRLKLTGEEATGLFSESFNAIIGAFEQQRKSAKTPIAAAFFVGGLSTNDWLWSQLRSYFEVLNIKVSRPDNHINKAVANGAVLSYIDRDNHLVAARVARATYGVLCSLPAKTNDEEHLRRKEKWEKDPSGNYFVPGFFESKLRRGTRVREDMEFRESFTLTENDPARFGIQKVRLQRYRGSQPAPEWADQDESSFSTFCIVHVDLSVTTKDLVPKKAGNKVYYQLDYDVVVFFGFTETRAQLCWMSEGREKRVDATVMLVD